MVGPSWGVPCGLICKEEHVSLFIKENEGILGRINNHIEYCIKFSGKSKSDFF